MCIAELGTHHEEYILLDELIRDMVSERRFPAVFSECEMIFPHIEPTIRYLEKQNLKPILPPITAFDVICKYAPALFEHSVIELFSSFIASNRFWEEFEVNYLQAAEMAFECEELARSLWNQLECETTVRQQDLQKQYGSVIKMINVIIDVWDYLEIIHRIINDNEESFQLQTRLDCTVEGMCAACGIIGIGEKQAFLRRVKCGRCGAVGHYHLTGIEMN